MRKVRLAIIERELQRRALRQLDARIDRQRAVWGDLPDSPAKERLIELLSDAAWKLLDGGQCEAADEILFILPESIAIKLLQDFFDPDDEGDDA